MWFGFNPAVNFCHFSTLMTLSFLASATSTSPKFDPCLLIILLTKALNNVHTVDRFVSYNTISNIMSFVLLYRLNWSLCLQKKCTSFSVTNG